MLFSDNLGIVVGDKNVRCVIVIVIKEVDKLDPHRVWVTPLIIHNAAHYQCAGFCFGVKFLPKSFIYPQHLASAIWYE